MSSVGTYLRELRERRGVSLEEIARTTRVAPRYLHSLEADAFDALPSPVFTRGFVRAYCQALGEAPDEALAAYESRPGGTPPPAARPQPAPRRTDAEPRGRGAVLVSFVLLVVLGMALFAVALVIHPRERGERIAAAPGSEPTASPSVEPAVPVPPPAPAAQPAAPVTRATSPAPGPAAMPSPAAPAASPPRPPASAPSPTALAPASSSPAAAPAPGAAAAPALEGLVGAVSSPYRLVARTSEPTWIRVRTDDGGTSEETVPAGEVREWISNRPFILTIGNAGGVSFELNGRTLPSLGAKGVVIQRIVLPPDAR